MVGKVTARLRIVLDQLVSPTDSDLATASRSLAEALIAAPPSGCDVGALAPAPSAQTRSQDGLDLAGVADVWQARVARRELAAAWRIGAPLGASGGMIHSPTLMAPLVRHDRAHDQDQTVVTLWSLQAWTDPTGLPRASAAWQRAMLARAVRHADAVVVPTHAMAADLAEIARLGGRIRVIAGAPAPGFGVPTDAAGRLRTLGLPARFIVALDSDVDSDELAPVLSAGSDLELDVVVLNVTGRARAERPAGAETREPGVRRVHVADVSDAADRAAVLAGALAVVAPSTAAVYPWRMLEALAVGAPLVAADTPQNQELLADAAILANLTGIQEGVRTTVGDEVVRDRLRVLSLDRSKAFSWRDAANRVWQLHAEL